MSTNGILTVLLILMIVVLVIAVVTGVGALIVVMRWRRRRLGSRAQRRPTAQSASATASTAFPAPQAPPHASMAPADRSGIDPVAHGDAPSDDSRIVALGLEEPASIGAVFRNLEKVKPLLRDEVAESDRISRTTPLAGGALRATGVFQWCFPARRGGLAASYADQLEAVTQVARIDVGMAWVVMWLAAHGDITDRLDDESFAELYPSIDLPTVFSATPPARAVEIAGKYRIEQGRWRLGSGGFHADRWLAAAKVWDSAGQPVISELTGEQKIIGVWLPADKVRQADDWDPLGVRSSGSASYYLTEPVEVPQSWSFDHDGDARPYFFPFMGIMVGAAQHLVDLTLEALRAKIRSGNAVGSHDMTALSEAMASLDMLVLGLRGYAQYLDRVKTERESQAITPGESAWIHNVGMPVRAALLSIRDITADIYGTGYVNASSEFGRVLRDLQVALAHGWFRLSDTQADHGKRVRMMLDDPGVTPLWDSGWPVELPTDS